MAADYTVEVGDESILSARIVRCGCGEPGSHAQMPCPRGRVEDVGVISHRVGGKRLLGGLFGSRGKKKEEG
jgi:hypothetical protein